MNKKIALLTLPLGGNYGGILQCYALQAVLERMGHEVVVLNRRWGTGRMSLALWILRCLSVLKCAFRRYVLRQEWWAVQKPWSASYMPDLRRARGRADRRFVNDFVRRHIHLTAPLYSTREMTRWAVARRVDAYVVGSDQVWREEYTPQVTDYFLGFLPDGARSIRVAYAASFGTERAAIAPGLLPQCARLARRFGAVSVRERSAVQVAREALGVDARWVLDPTLLLQPSDYQFAARAGSLCWPGVVSYILDGTAGKSQVVRDAASALSQPVFEISLTPLDEEGLPQSMLPVEEWLRAFAQARFVVTDSFHGCVFSILHRKPFVAIANHGRGLDRFTSLLGSLGLSGRLVSSAEEYMQRRASLLSPIDYAPVEQRLAEAREASLAFLREALGEGIRPVPPA